MRSAFTYILLIAAIAVAVAGVYIFSKTKLNSNPQATISPTTTVSVASPSPTVTTTKAANIYYPIDQFPKRLTQNSFGSFYTSQSPQVFDRNVCLRATEYTGYHTGDDLETFAGEQNSSVSIKAVAGGKVLQAGTVSGYGGLIVIEHTFGGQTYTAYYGHIDLNTTALKTGDKVTAGDKIAELAPACSSANDNVRKHLHFGLHKSSAVDVRGYVTDQATLQNWADPSAVLTDLNAD